MNLKTLPASTSSAYLSSEASETSSDSHTQSSASFNNSAFFARAAAVAVASMLTVSFFIILAVQLSQKNIASSPATPLQIASKQIATPSPFGTSLKSSSHTISSRSFQSTSIDTLFGNLLVVIGYLLLPSVGIILMRRARAHAQVRQAVLSGSLNLDGAEMNALPSLSGARPLFSNSSKRARMIDEHTKLVTWVHKSEQCDHHHSTSDSDVDGTGSECMSDSDESVDNFQAVDSTQCAVCLSHLKHGDAARILPCNHIFHHACADLWLINSAKDSCPLCMQPVVPFR